MALLVLALSAAGLLAGVVGFVGFWKRGSIEGMLLALFPIALNAFNAYFTLTR